MASWLKIVIVVLGLVLLAGALQRFGLPTAPLKDTVAPPAAQQASPAAPATTAPAPTAPSPSATAQPTPAPSQPTPAPSQPVPSQQAVVAPSAAVPAPAAPAPAAPAAKADDAPGPTFDVVRVEPDGTSVIAGRGVPGAEILLLLNGAVHERAKADGGGQFAIVPKAMPPGNHELTLQIRHPDGRIEASKQTVTVVIPSTPGGDVIVALAQPDRPTELLSRPRAAAAPAPTPAPAPTDAAQPASPGAPAATGPRSRIVVTTVEAEDSGRFYATGQAAPGAIVRLYLNETFLATATAGPDGRWSFTIGRGLEPGSYRVRVDDVEQPTGTVLSRAEVPFTFSPRVAAASPAPATGGAASAARPSAPAGTAPSQPTAAGAGPSQAPAAASAAPGGSAPTAVASATPPTLVQGADALVPEIRSTMVSRGDSLWRISRRVYGKGVRYTVIYEANQQQIRDPRRIYPGQMFVLPAEKP